MNSNEINEINALRPEDIDLEGGIIHVRSTISSDLYGKPVLKKGAKTENGVRDIPISASLRPVLEEALEKQVKNRYGLVFCTHKKKGLITTGSVNSQFRQILRAAGIEPCGQHALRHTFATRCIEAGIPAVVLKTWLGHADIHMTLDIYTDVFNEMHHDAIRKLDAYLDEQE